MPFENRSPSSESMQLRPSMYPSVRDNIVGWLQEVYGSNVPLQSQIDKLREEWMELEVTWRDTPDDNEEIINELTDIAIVAVGILGLYGADFEQEAAKKVRITQSKYDPRHIRALQLKGYSLEEALQFCKDNWSHIPNEPQTTTRLRKIGV